MSEDRTLRKLKKLTGRLSTRMEEMRDLMDDMEIEFEMMQKQIKQGSEPLLEKMRKQNLMKKHRKSSRKRPDKRHKKRR